MEKEVVTLNEYQKEAHKTASYTDEVSRTFPFMEPEVKQLLALSYVSNGLGEAGEIQNKVKKIIRDTPSSISKQDKEELKKEYGDLLWYIAEGANLLGFSLQEIAQGNVDKLRSRAARGKIQGSGDNR